ncbi:unnamed protein product [Mytilus coruscus]|uniref:Uncharacterized protein n=1 Tax=Mytilus coruscus TaxID=42192 RepID=A0A6J8BSQ5_MYTCO|nr:unnamed protein product [Mytilus coruscus]
MIKYLADGTYEEALPHFRSRMKTLLSTRENFEHELNKSFQKIFSSMEEFIRNGSGWQLEEVLQLDVTITKYKPLGRGSYMLLPVSLAKSHSLVNVTNTDERCLVWSILASLHYDKERKDPQKNKKRKLIDITSDDENDVSYGSRSHVYSYKRKRNDREDE